MAHQNRGMANAWGVMRDRRLRPAPELFYLDRNHWRTKLGNALLSLLQLLILATKQSPLDPFRDVDKGVFRQAYSHANHTIREAMIRELYEVPHDQLSPRALSYVFLIFDFLRPIDPTILQDFFVTTSQHDLKMLSFLTDGQRDRVASGSWAMLVSSKQFTIQITQKCRPELAGGHGDTNLSGLIGVSEDDARRVYECCKTMQDEQGSFTLKLPSEPEVSPATGSIRPFVLSTLVKIYCELALLDLFKTEVSSIHWAIKRDPERLQILYGDKTKPQAQSSHFRGGLMSLKGRKRQLAKTLQKFWPDMFRTSVRRWITMMGLSPIEVAKGLFHFQWLCMRPTAQMVSDFMLASSHSPFGIDGDLPVGSKTNGKAVRAWQFFCFEGEGLSLDHLHILGPTMNEENNKFVKRKFQEITKVGYKNRIWHKHKSMLRYGFILEPNKVPELNLKVNVKKMVDKFLRTELPEEFKMRAIFLYRHLKTEHLISDLPLAEIFKYANLHHHWDFARQHVENQRNRERMKVEGRKERRRSREAQMITAGVDMDVDEKESLHSHGVPAIPAAGSTWGSPSRERKRGREEGGKRGREEGVTTPPAGSPSAKKPRGDSPN